MGLEGEGTLAGEDGMGGGGGVGWGLTQPSTQHLQSSNTLKRSPHKLHQSTGGSHTAPLSQHRFLALSSKFSTGYATEGPHFISVHLSTNAVSTKGLGTNTTVEAM